MASSSRIVNIGTLFAPLARLAPGLPCWSINKRETTNGRNQTNQPNESKQGPQLLLAAFVLFVRFVVPLPPPRLCRFVCLPLAVHCSPTRSFQRLLPCWGGAQDI